MKLTLDAIQQTGAWDGYNLPQYDLNAVRQATHDAPVWLHFGAGNLFRAFPAALAQRMLSDGATQTGVICCDSYDEELIDRCYRSCDQLFVVVTLNSQGVVRKEVIGSVTESLKFSEDFARLEEIFSAPSLQMVTFSITEKGYAIRDDNYMFLPNYEYDKNNGPAADCHSFFGKLAYLSLERCRKGLSPLAFVSLDNCPDNGDLLERAMRYMVNSWLEHRFITSDEHRYLLKQNTYPLSMIDKITPHPDERIAHILEQDGLEDMQPFMTAKNTSAAHFVNTEQIEYLLIEDAFPNGHPPLERYGVVITDRMMVDKTATMKASTCMNPMDTTLAVYGCLLGYRYISDEMKDSELVTLITRLTKQEMLPVATDTATLHPEKFLNELLEERYRNDYLRDTPQRIMTDTSRKLAVRFGVALYAYYNSMDPAHQATRLTYIPLAIAGWLRYLVGVDDQGNAFERSPDPNFGRIHELIGDLKLGDCVKEDKLYPLLSNRYYFGVNLFEIGVGYTVIHLFNELNRGPGAVRETLRKYCSET